MDARELLAELAARGIEVRAAGEELEIRPGGVVPAGPLDLAERLGLIERDGGASQEGRRSCRHWPRSALGDQS